MSHPVIRIFILLALLQTGIACKEKKNAEEKPVILFPVTDSLRILKKQTDSLQAELQYWFSDTDLKRLQRSGLKDPAVEMDKDLRLHTELIPVKGILGGSMQFAKITQLGDRWVIADFDDGHVSGRMLLRYTVSANGKFSWKRLDYYME